MDTDRDAAREPPHWRHWPAKIPHDLALPQTSVWYNLEVSATRYPDRAAVVFYGSTLTYRALRRQVEAIAGWLQVHCGVGRGDRVLLDFQNSPQFVAGYYAILRADAFVVPVNPMLKTEELEHYVADSGARVVLCADDVFAQFQPLMGAGSLAHALVGAYADALTEPTTLAVPDFVRAPPGVETSTRVTRWADAVALDLTPSASRAGPDDWCVMPYTSGTTGKPKGCVHTHRSVMHVLVTGSLWAGVSERTVALGVVPMFHVTGMQSMNGLVYSAATNVVLPRWNRDVAAAMIEHERVNAFTCIPTMIIDLFGKPDLDRHDLSSLTYVSGGGAAMPEAIAQRMKDLWGVDFIEGYGLSETIAASHINPLSKPKKQCLGIPICGTDSRIVDPETLEEVPHGETGEIITHGPGVFQGYWKDDEKTRDALIQHDGKTFLRTGDLARIDEDGFFFMVDRLKRMINASGFKVWPAEVEAMLYRHPAVQEACVIAARDAYRGETVKALVVARADAKGKVTGDDITSWAREHMAAYKIPRIVEFVDALPKSGTGKVMWRALQEAEAAKG